MPADRGRPEDLKEACVTEALAIIAATGLETLSLREVARRLGVSHQAPYRHFPSRDHILAAVVARAFDHFSAYLDSRQQVPDNPAQDLRGMGLAYLSYADEHPLQYRLMFATPLPNPADHPGMMQSARHAFTLLEQGVARMRATQGQPCTEELVTLDALFIWAALHGLAGIRGGCAITTLRLSSDILGQAPAHLLGRIGQAMGNPCGAKADG